MEEIVQKLERHRLRIYYLMLAGTLSIVVGVMCILYSWLPWYVCLSILGVGLCLWIGSGQTKKRYVMRYKRELVSALLQEEFEEVVFEPEHGITKDEIAEVKLRDYGNKLYARNRFEGCYKGVHFVFSELRLVAVDEKNKEVKEKELFHGKWISFDLNKHFKGEIQVHRNPTVRYKHLEKVHFEDVAFNKRFRTFATDQQIAVGIVTPHLMEKIVKIGSNEEFDLCFQNGRLHTAVKASGDYFEPPIFMKIDLILVRKRLEEGVQEIKRYVEVLELYKKNHVS
ncbi:MAG: DUF3137 domain-containing protein [Cellulosilyticaceae bacterium]